MQSATPFKRLLQATITVGVSFATLTVIGTNPAQAVNLKTFNISGNFAPAVEDNSVGLPVSLANGSFNGTYTVDVERLPASSSFVDLTSWNVNLVNDNTVLRTLSNSLAGNTAYIQENILAFADAGLLAEQNNNLYSLELYFDSNFIGRGSTNNGIFLDNSDLGSVQSSGITAVTSAKSEVVPEPRTIVGTVVVAIISLWLKRKRKAEIAA
ncbi:PEP-CTERM sorting domain-containing protein [Halotia branconii]|uniref:PEP-CTERM sorting domain-containing protein n=1 Tax=Halotia branconii CENA392 TaxID=1539056 RepID=A0AAJ6NU18_9CYAN|nr:PEP-CTERM sorting domain-containing protein [Halotia branconii]WGV26528.1 PEP-CTERM sorting domain-containing protein [Halotia branconii CENA392]